MMRNILISKTCLLGVCPREVKRGVAAPESLENPPPRRCLKAMHFQHETAGGILVEVYPKLKDTNQSRRW